MRLRVALVGCGRWGARLAVHLARHRDLELVAVVDPAPGARSRAMAAACGAGRELLAAASLSDALAARPAAACVATPPEAHAPVAIAALEAGLHVLVEKPLASSSAAARRMCAAAAGSGRIAMAAQVLRYHPAYERMMELLAAGAIGALRRVHCRRFTQSGSPDPLLTLCSHDAATLLALDRSGLARASSAAGDDGRVVVQLELRSGLCARLEASTTAGQAERRVVLVGRCGRLLLDELDARAPLWLEPGAKPAAWAEPAGHTERVAGTERTAVPVPAGDALGRQLAHFAACVRRGRAPRTGFEAGARITSLLEQARQSLGRQRLGRRDGAEARARRVPPMSPPAATR